MEYRNIKDLICLENNPRQITKKDLDILKKSIKNNPDYFEARPIILSNRTGKLVIIAGNQRLKVCKELGIETVPTYLLKNLSEEREKEIIIRDNVNNGDWDFDLLVNEWNVEDLENWGVEILKNDTNEEEKESIYTSKITSPIYEKQLNEKPKIEDCLNTEKRNKFFEKIKKLDCSDEEKSFLYNCANRFLEFNYRNIAEYYCHSNKEIQDIMEDMALIIIDYNKAIEKGYIELSVNIKKELEQEYE